jgi:hypothetical protein
MKRYLLAVLMVGLLALPSSAGMIISSSITQWDFSSDANLQAWFNFENNLTDGSANANTIAYFIGGGDVWTSSDKMNGTYALSTVTSTIKGRHNDVCSANLPGVVSSVCTAGGWVYITSLNATINSVFLDVCGGTANSWHLNIDANGKANFQVYDTTPTDHSAVGQSTLSLNTWYFLVGTYDGSNVRIYKGDASTAVAEDDSAPVACTSMYSNATSSAYLSLGGYFMFGGMYFPFNGYLDDLFCFDRVISTAEMNSIRVHGLNNSH